MSEMKNEKWENFFGNVIINENINIFSLFGCSMSSMN